MTIADESKLARDPLAKVLIGKIDELKIQDSSIYYNFPFYRGETRDDLVQAHVLFVSKEFGVVIFKCLSDSSLFTEEEKVKFDTLDGHIFAKINKHEALRLGKRDLKINISQFVFVEKKKGQIILIL